MTANRQPPAPPPFIRQAAHPLRWRILAELSRADYRVRELVELLGAPQNLVSYHLRQLRDAGLVAARRSSFDGRDTYYHLDLGRCAEALAATGAALHPALGPAAASPALVAERPQPPAVLFVCTGNSARSPIAEALLRHRTEGSVTVASAGTRPKDAIHPGAIRALRKGFGIDIGDQRPRHIETVAGRRFDHVITLCDRAREACPDFDYRPRRAHWSIPDPVSAAEPGDRAFERTAAEIDTRIRYLLPLLAAP